MHPSQDESSELLFLRSPRSKLAVLAQRFSTLALEIHFPAEFSSQPWSTSTACNFLAILKTLELNCMKVDLEGQSWEPLC